MCVKVHLSVSRSAENPLDIREGYKVKDSAIIVFVDDGIRHYPVSLLLSCRVRILSRFIKLVLMHTFKITN